MSQVEEKRGLRNTVSEEIARAKKAGQNADERMAAMREVGGQIKAIEGELKLVEDRLGEELLQVPNLADPTAPEGGEEDSEVVLTWGTPRRVLVPAARPSSTWPRLWI